MLKDLVNFEEHVALIMRSGVQFLDLPVSIDAKKLPPGEFVRQESNLSLARLVYAPAQDAYFYPTRPDIPARSSVSVPLDESLELLEGVWIPVPFLRFSVPDKFAEGPSNWARAMIISTADDPTEQQEGRTHRVVIAFDTNALEADPTASYLAPTVEDVRSGAPFRLAHLAHQMGWYIEAPWVSAWINEVFVDNMQARNNASQEDIDEQKQEMRHFAHYLNVLHVIGEYARPPEVRLQSNLPEDRFDPIQVDLVLDVGNSRTCGVLIEEHPQENDGLKRRYEIELRDLTRPAQTYRRPFESRVEFADASFGKDDLSVQSGLHNAFKWPTIARVGPEATLLASHRRGTEGSTGLSGPKRYLWDEEAYAPGWRFNCAFSKKEIEPLATAAPFTKFINERGEALYKLPREERMPVFNPHYSRSSLMMFMLAEVLTQAIVQINSAAQRLKQTHSSRPRHLRRIVLTVPPSMPKPEREIFKERVHQAMALVWKSLEWHDGDADPDDREVEAWPPFPEISVEFDEASCGQVVYLFSEIQNSFSGHPEEFFDLMRRRDGQSEDRDKLRIASIDIGGGTTDLVIVDYALDDGKGANVFIVPDQKFRDGFKIAGDDIILDVIQDFVLPAFAEALKEYGVSNPDAFLSRLVGSEAVDAHESVLRQQFSLQVLYPIGLRIIQEYEGYDPVEGRGEQIYTFGDLLGERLNDVSPAAINFIGNAARREAGSSDAFDALNIALPLNLKKLHENFLTAKYDICKSLRALCEIVFSYHCDVLLVTGRPSRMPGVLSLLRALAPLPPGRIIPMQDFRVGYWYPFHQQGKIGDPKTTAAVGAALSVLGRGRLPNFFFRSDAFHPYSTVKFVGLMDDKGIIRDNDVYYSNIDLDDPDWEMPETTFEMRGLMRIGFRQLGVERWAASPLYTLSFVDEKIRDRVFKEGVVLKVRLKSESRRGKGGGNDRLSIASVESDSGSVSARSIRMRLNTLASGGVGETEYWLDSGSVYR